MLCIHKYLSFSASLKSLETVDHSFFFYYTGYYYENKTLHFFWPLLYQCLNAEIQNRSLTNFNSDISVFIYLCFSNVCLLNNQFAISKTILYQADLNITKLLMQKWISNTKVCQLSKLKWYTSLYKINLNPDLHSKLPEIRWWNYLFYQNWSK